MARWYEISETQRHHGERQQRQVRRLVAGEVPGDAAEQQRVGDPVDGRVEERAALARCVGRLGQRAVEQVGQRGQDDEDQAEEQVP